MKRSLQIRRTFAAIIAVALVSVVIYSNSELWQTVPATPAGQNAQNASGQAADTLELLAVKGRAPKTGYARTQFGDGWKKLDGCDTRNIILHRDLTDATVNDKCQ